MPEANGLVQETEEDLVHPNDAPGPDTLDALLRQSRALATKRAVPGLNFCLKCCSTISTVGVRSDLLQ